MNDIDIDKKDIEIKIFRFNTNSLGVSNTDNNDADERIEWMEIEVSDWKHRMRTLLKPSNEELHIVQINQTETEQSLTICVWFYIKEKEGYF